MRELNRHTWLRPVRPGKPGQPEHCMIPAVGIPSGLTVVLTPT